MRRAGGGAAKNTPIEVIDKLNKEINAGLQLIAAEPRSGPRWSNSPASRRTDAAIPLANRLWYWPAA